MSSSVLKRGHFCTARFLAGHDARLVFRGLFLVRTALFFSCTGARFTDRGLTLTGARSAVTYRACTDGRRDLDETDTFLSLTGRRLWVVYQSLDDRVTDFTGAGCVLIVRRRSLRFDGRL